MTGQGQRSPCAVGLLASQRNVVAAAHERETERLQGPDDPLQGSVNGELGHGRRKGALAQAGIAASATNASKIGPSSAGASEATPKVSAWKAMAERTSDKAAS